MNKKKEALIAPLDESQSYFALFPFHNWMCPIHAVVYTAVRQGVQRGKLRCTP
ncbi:MAG: hypothetical protein ACK5JU_10635 [Bacteroidales bacterium]